MINIVYLLAGFMGMELVAYCTHKYVMHGFLWSLHRSHHQKGRSFFEWNDLYFLLFAFPGALLLIFGVQDNFNWMFYVGVGITLYGAAYLLVHDIIIHQRIRWFTHLDNSYFRALRRAHKAHHANVDKDAARSFGMLWVAKKYYDDLSSIKKRHHGQIRFFFEHDYPF